MTTHPAPASPYTDRPDGWEDDGEFPRPFPLNAYSPPNDAQAIQAIAAAAYTRPRAPQPSQHTAPNPGGAQTGTQGHPRGLGSDGPNLEPCRGDRIDERLEARDGPMIQPGQSPPPKAAEAPQSEARGTGAPESKQFVTRPSSASAIVLPPHIPVLWLTGENGSVQTKLAEPEPQAAPDMETAILRAARGDAVRAADPEFRAAFFAGFQCAAEALAEEDLDSHMPAPKSRWLHWQGGAATVLPPDLDSDTGLPLRRVRYMHEEPGKDTGPWSRPVREWEEVIRRPGFEGPRFRRAEEGGR